MSELRRLHPDDLAAIAEAVAVRVADLLAEREAPPHPATSSPMLTAADVARRFGVTAEWVREHADELGVIRLGDGPRPRLRFELGRVAEALDRRASCPEDRRSDAPSGPAAADDPGPRRRRPVPTGAQLLPIRGRDAV